MAFAPLDATLHQQRVLRFAVDAAVVAPDADISEAEFAIERDRMGVVGVDAEFDLFDVAFGGVRDAGGEQAAAQPLAAERREDAHAQDTAMGALRNVDGRDVGPTDDVAICDRAIGRPVIGEVLEKECCPRIERRLKTSIMASESSQPQQLKARICQY